MNDMYTSYRMSPTITEPVLDAGPDHAKWACARDSKCYELEAESGISDLEYTQA